MFQPMTNISHKVHRQNLHPTHLPCDLLMHLCYQPTAVLCRSPPA